MKVRIRQASDGYRWLYGEFVLGAHSRDWREIWIGPFETVEQALQSQREVRGLSFASADDTPPPQTYVMPKSYSPTWCAR